VGERPQSVAGRPADKKSHPSPWETQRKRQLQLNPPSTANSSHFRSRDNPKSNMQLGDGVELLRDRLSAHAGADLFNNIKTSSSTGGKVRGRRRLARSRSWQGLDAVTAAEARLVARQQAFFDGERYQGQVVTDREMPPPPSSRPSSSSPTSPLALRSRKQRMEAGASKGCAGKAPTKPVSEVSANSSRYLKEREPREEKGGGAVEFAETPPANYGVSVAASNTSSADKSAMETNRGRSDLSREQIQRLMSAVSESALGGTSTLSATSSSHTVGHGVAPTHDEIRRFIEYMNEGEQVAAEAAEPSYAAAADHQSNVHQHEDDEVDEEEEDSIEVAKRNKTASQYFYRQHYLSIIQEEEEGGSVCGDPTGPSRPLSTVSTSNNVSAPLCSSPRASQQRATSAAVLKKAFQDFRERQSAHEDDAQYLKERQQQQLLQHLEEQRPQNNQALPSAQHESRSQGKPWSTTLQGKGLFTQPTKPARKRDSTSSDTSFDSVNSILSNEAGGGGDVNVGGRAGMTGSHFSKGTPSAAIGQLLGAVAPPSSTSPLPMKASSVGHHKQQTSTSLESNKSSNVPHVAPMVSMEPHMKTALDRPLPLPDRPPPDSVSSSDDEMAMADSRCSSVLPVKDLPRDDDESSVPPPPVETTKATNELPVDKKVLSHPPTSSGSKVGGGRYLFMSLRKKGKASAATNQEPLKGEPDQLKEPTRANKSKVSRFFRSLGRKSHQSTAEDEDEQSVGSTASRRSSLASLTDRIVEKITPDRSNKDSKKASTLSRKEVKASNKVIKEENKSVTSKESPVNQNRLGTTSHGHTRVRVLPPSGSGSPHIMSSSEAIQLKDTASVKYKQPSSGLETLPLIVRPTQIVNEPHVTGVNDRDIHSSDFRPGVRRRPRGRAETSVCDNDLSGHERVGANKSSSVSNNVASLIAECENYVLGVVSRPTKKPEVPRRTDSLEKHAGEEDKYASDFLPNPFEEREDHGLINEGREKTDDRVPPAAVVKANDGSDNQHCILKKQTSDGPIYQPKLVIERPQIERLKLGNSWETSSKPSYESLAALRGSVYENQSVPATPAVQETIGSNVASVRMPI
jgi:predicted nucleic acid binding AN1-type Zn finger protein